MQSGLLALCALQKELFSFSNETLNHGTQNHERKKKTLVKKNIFSIGNQKRFHNYNHRLVWKYDANLISKQACKIHTYLTIWPISLLNKRTGSNGMQIKLKHNCKQNVKNKESLYSVPNQGYTNLGNLQHNPACI
jgi:hypothetical protein